jgi:hypothetical protein
MKLPELQNSRKYTGLYVLDFGDHTGVGFTAEEAAELLESEEYKHCKVYKIYRAWPDGRLELKAVPAEIFQLEAGMFFCAGALETARADFKRLAELAERTACPCRAKLHLAGYGDGKFVTAIIYPAEYDDQFSRWLLDGGYKTDGSVEGGVGAVQRYYDSGPQLLDSRQLFGSSEMVSRTGEQLLACLKLAVQR